MLENPHFDLPDNEFNRELFETSIDWNKEEALLKKLEKQEKRRKIYSRIKALLSHSLWRK